MPPWPPTPDARQLFRQCSMPSDPRTQGNLVAYSIGLGTSADGWTQRTISHLVFLRWLVCTGRLGPRGD